MTCFLVIVIVLVLWNVALCSAFTSTQPKRRRHIGCSQSAVSENQIEQQVRVRDVRFASPLIEEGYPPAVESLENNTLAEKPLLLYLPGFDGTWLSFFIHMPELSTIFDVRCLTMTMSDRSTYQELKETVIDFIYKQLSDDDELAKQAEGAAASKEHQQPSNSTSKSSNFLSSFRKSDYTQQSNKKQRSVYLMGESFGGILASDVALTLVKEKKLENLKGLTVINSATCYDRSKLASMGPSVVSSPKLLYPFALLRLLPLFTDEYSLPQLLLILQSKRLPSVIDTPAREAFMGRIAFSLPQKLQYMPQETLKWRLEQWLETGCGEMATRLSQYANLDSSFRTLIVAGEKDYCLPSIDEAERLLNLLPNNHVHVVEGAGHASTCGSRVDLAALLRNRFPELVARRHHASSRTAMKPVAAKATGIEFGMEPRYNEKEEGLSPLLYWAETHYRKM